MLNYYACSLYEFLSCLEGLNGNTNVFIVAALLLDALIMGILRHWVPLVLVLVLIMILYQKYMSEKDQHSQVLNPNQYQENNISISERDLRSSTSQPAAAKNINITINVQSSSKINAVDENGRNIISIQSNENASTCFLETVCKHVNSPNTPPACLKYEGPLKGKKYQRLTKKYRQLIHSGDIDNVRQITEKFLASSEPHDLKVVAMIYCGFSHQIRSYKTTNCFENSERDLEKALKMCQESDCVNTRLLEGRIYTFMAQNSFFDERYEDAKCYIRATGGAFSSVADCTEKSGFVYQQVMILSIEYEVNSTDEQKRRLEELLERAIYLARLSNDYQAICLTAFMFIKKAMLHLGIFNLLHTRFHRRKSAEDFKPSYQDILGAKNSLDNVSQEFIQDPEVSRYKALYYFALSDYHRHAGNIIEARDNLDVATKQVKNGNFDFPMEEIEVRRTLLSKLSTNDSIQDIFDTFCDIN